MSIAIEDYVRDFSIPLTDLQTTELLESKYHEKPITWPALVKVVKWGWDFQNLEVDVHFISKLKLNHPVWTSLSSHLAFPVSEKKNLLSLNIDQLVTVSGNISVGRGTDFTKITLKCPQIKVDGSDFQSLLIRGVFT